MAIEKQINKYLEEIFGKVGKEKLNLELFIEINKNHTSEMFLSVRTLFYINAE